MTSCRATLPAFSGDPELPVAQSPIGATGMGQVQEDQPSEGRSLPGCAPSPFETAASGGKNAPVERF